VALDSKRRKEMPRLSQAASFPEQGHRLCNSDDQVLELLRSAGFGQVKVQLPEREGARGRLAIATA